MDKTPRNLGGTSFKILLALALSHAFNDTFQSLISAIYPLIKDSLSLTFTQIGLITLTFQFASSVFQPFVGWYTDKRPQPYSLPIGMACTLIGLLSLSMAGSFLTVLISVALVGVGSSIFHPEASRLAFMASGGKYGLAQSLFQVGGNFGGSLAPLLAALVIAPYGQRNVGFFSLIALISIAVMIPISRWYKQNLHLLKPRAKGPTELRKPPLSQRKVAVSLGILLVLIFSKYAYMASFVSYYTFYLMQKFQITIRTSQFCLFLFLFAVAAGTMIGGPIGDRIGRKYVIWASILGIAPFTILMPYVNSLFWVCVLSMLIGLILSSAFSAILVFAQELKPGNVGTIAGLFFGFAFGIAGIASAILGKIADETSLQFVFHLCSFLPLLGLVTYFLPNIRKQKHEG